ncbi:hypothetical protein GOBAR_AA32381 [Gossypium barbadense]|uniref:Uncharacterized protein n=1 Tax=Gossypium barbadense TaxID=3634 RepID=A0A2P5WB36_GOSBA|nr:hypothetical protein GOBAR_AA32381 [Gossypium barbadense]
MEKLEPPLPRSSLKRKEPGFPRLTHTDYLVIPSEPEPKQCTKPEPFQLESLVRHEEEMKRQLEERQRNEKEEAQPILKE